MGFIMLKSSQTQITQLKNYLIVFSVTYGSYVKSSEVIDSKIRSINGKQSRKKVEYAEIELSYEIDEEKMKDYVQKKASLKEEIDKMEQEKEN